MADGESFVLKLIDKLTGPADRMLRTVRQLTGTADSAANAVNKLGFATAKAGQMAGAADAKMRSYARALAAVKKAEAVTDAQGRIRNISGQFVGKSGFKRKSFAHIRHGGANAPTGAAAWGESFMGGVRGLLSMNKAAGEAISKWGDMKAAFMTTPLGMVASGIGTIGGKLYDLGEYLASAAWGAAKLSYALGAIAAAYVTKEVIELAAFSERASLSFKALTGSSELGAKAFNRARATADELGLSVETTAQSFIDLLAAQFSIEQSEALTKLSEDLATVTGHADAAGRIINAISKIKATGRLQGDELMMLAEAGLSLDLVYSRLEKNLGKSRAQILKLQQAGGISAEQAITAIQEAIMQKTHEKRAGEAAGRFAATTLSGAWRQLQAAPRNFLLKVGERIDTTPLVAGMRKIIDAFKGSAGDQVVQFVNIMVRGLGRVLAVLPHFAAGFSESFGAILSALSFGDRDYEGAARDAGKWLGNFFAKSIELAGKLLPIVENLADKFLKGFDAGTLAKQIEQMNFAQIGKDLATVASALGQIFHWVAKLAPYFIATGQLGVAAATSPSYTALGSGDEPLGFDKFGKPIDPTKAGQLNALPEGMRGEGLIPSALRGIRGLLTDDNNFYDPSGTTPGYPTSPGGETIGPTASLMGAGGPRIGSMSIEVNGAGVTDPKELAKAIGREFDKRMQRVADGQLGEAVVT